MRVLTFLLLICLSAPATAEELDPQAFLPPAPAWDGRSRSLMADESDPWITPAERTGLTATPRYDETMAWLGRLAQASPSLSVVTIGRSHEGREIRMVVASTTGASDPDALRADGRPVVLVHAGYAISCIDEEEASRTLALIEEVTGPLLGIEGTEGEVQ